MKTLILGLTCLLLILACHKNIENPHSPEPPEEKAVIEFCTYEPFLSGPDYGSPKEYMTITLQFCFINRGPVATKEYIYIIVRMHDKVTEKAIFAVRLLAYTQELPVGWSVANFRISFTMPTEVWDKYLIGEAYKILLIVLGD